MLLKPRPDSQQCLSRSIIEDYLRNALDEAAKEAVETHICFCTYCIKALEEERAYQESLRSALRRSPAVDRSDRASVGSSLRRAASGYKFWALAGLSAVALILLVLPPPTQKGTQTMPLLALRNDITNPAARANTQLILKPDMRGIGDDTPIWLELVHADGTAIERRRFEPKSNDITWLLSAGLPKGDYWVRAYNDSSHPVLLREFSLRVR